MKISFLAIKSPKNEAREKKRRLSSLIFASIYLIISFFWGWSLIDEANIGIYEFEEQVTKTAGDGRTLATNHLSSIGAMSITAIAAIWVLLLLDDSRVRVATRFAWWLFWSANAYLTTSFLLHMAATENIASVLWKYGDIDPTKGVVNILIVGNKLYFILGILNMAFFAIQCLKPYEDEE